MKKINLIYGLLSLLVVAIGCNKSEDKPNAGQTTTEQIHELKVSPENVGIIVGEKATATISSGNGSYSITSADQTIATASVSETTISVEAKKEGETTLTLTDAKKKNAKIKVKVYSAIGVKEPQVTLKIRDEKEVEIIGGAEKINLLVDNENVKAEVSDRKVKITAQKVGESIITITDETTKKTATIKVSVQDYPSVEVSKTDTQLLLKSQEEIMISGGSGTYKATANNQNVTISLEGNKLKITGAKVGKSVVTITDEKAQKSVKINITISYGEMAVDVTTLEVRGKIYVNGVLGEGEKKSFKIIGGSGSYEVIKNNENISLTQKSNTEYEVQGNIQNTRGDETSIITIKDKSTQKEITLNVKILKRLQVTQNSLTLSEGFTAVLHYYGVKPTKFTFENNEFAEVVSVNDTPNDTGRKEITLKGKKAGRTKLTISDGVDPHKLDIIVQPKPVFSIVTTLPNNTLTLPAEGGELHVKGSGHFNIKVTPEIVDVHNDNEKQHDGNYIIIFELKDEESETKTASVTITDTELNQSKTFTLKVE